MIRAGMDSREAIGMTRTMLENRFRQEHILRAQEIVMQALKEGLPPDPIMNKAREGMAKRVQEENIIQAMEKVRSRYEFANQRACEFTQKEASKMRIMKQVAECAAAGMTIYDLDRVVYRLKFRIQEMQKNPAVDLTEETFRAVKAMARMHVSSMTATDVALVALENRYGTQEMKTMRRSFIRHSRDTSPNFVAEVYADAIRQRRNLETLDVSHMERIRHKGGMGKSAGSGSSYGSGGVSSQGSGAGGGPGRGSGGAGKGSGGSGGGRP